MFLRKAGLPFEEKNVDLLRGAHMKVKVPGPSEIITGTYGFVHSKNVDLLRGAHMKVKVSGPSEIITGTYGFVHSKKVDIS